MSPFLFRDVLFVSARLDAYKLLQILFIIPFHPQPLTFPTPEAACAPLTASEPQPSFKNRGDDRRDSSGQSHANARHQALFHKIMKPKKKKEQNTSILTWTVFSTGKMKKKKTKELEYGWKAPSLLPEYVTTGEDFCSLIGSQRPDLQANVFMTNELKKKFRLFFSTSA